jgi:hypothetical protein
MKIAIQAGQIAILLIGLASALSSEVKIRLAGIENCPNKCDKVFDRTQYAISDQPNADTFEFS